MYTLLLVLVSILYLPLSASASYAVILASPPTSTTSSNTPLPCLAADSTFSYWTPSDSITATIRYLPPSLNTCNNPTPSAASNKEEEEEEWKGRIVLIARGNCSFAAAARMVQNRGGVGLIVVSWGYCLLIVDGA